MSEMNYELLYKLLIQNKNQISSKFDLMNLFTCWYFTCKSYHHVKGNEKTNLLEVWNKFESTFEVQHVKTGQTIRIMLTPSDSIYSIYFESFAPYKQSKKLKIEYDKYINFEDKTMSDAIKLVKEYDVCIEYIFSAYSTQHR